MAGLLSKLECLPPNGGFLFHVFFYLHMIMFTIQYWNERDAQWKGTGSGTIYDKDSGSHAYACSL